MRIFARGIRTHLPMLLALLVSGFGAWLLWYSSVWGVGVSPDSAEYIAAARRLGAPADVFTLPTQWAPAYPVLLSLVYLLADDTLLLTRVLHCMLLAANGFAAIALLRAVNERNSLLPPLGGAVVLLGATLWQVNFYAWSEGPFLLCLQGSALALLQHLRQPSLSRLAVACVLAALAVMLRYAGVAWIAAASLTLLLLQPGSQRARWRSALLFGIAAITPFLLWLLANYWIRQQTTNRELVVHLIDSSDLLALLQQIAGWLGWQRGPVLFATETLLALAMCWQLGRIASVPAGLRHLLVLCGVQVVVYTAFIVFSRSFLDAYIPFDDRIFSPAWLFAQLALVACALQLIQIRQTRMLGAMALLIFGVGNAAQLAPEVAGAHSQGMGYLNAYMESVSDVRGIEALQSVKVYSNAPDYLRMRTTFDVHDYPRKFDPTTELANPGYSAELAAITAEVRAGTALLVHYRAFEWRAYFPRQNELLQAGYQSLRRGNDVSLLGMPVTSGVDAAPGQ